MTQEERDHYRDFHEDVRWEELKLEQDPGAKPDAFAEWFFGVEDQYDLYLR